MSAENNIHRPTPPSLEIVPNDPMTRRSLLRKVGSGLIATSVAFASLTEYSLTNELQSQNEITKRTSLYAEENNISPKSTQAENYKKNLEAHTEEQKQRGILEITAALPVAALGGILYLRNREPKARSK